MFSKFYGDNWQGFVGISLVIGKSRATHAIGFVLVANACDEGMLARSLSGVKNLYWALAGNDHLPVGEADPLIAIVREQAVAMCPIVGFILPPVGMNSLGDLRRQTVHQATCLLS